MEHMERSAERAVLLEKVESSAKNSRWRMNVDAELYERHHGKVLNAVVGFSTTVFAWLQGNGTEPMKQMEWSAERTVLLKRDDSSAKRSRWRMNAEAGWGAKAKLDGG